MLDLHHQGTIQPDDPEKRNVLLSLILGTWKVYVGGEERDLSSRGSINRASQPTSTLLSSAGAKRAHPLVP